MATEPIQEFKCNGTSLDVSCDDPHYPEPRYSGARIINPTQDADPQKMHRWMVTMVNRWTGTEELLDIVCEGGSFRDMVDEVRRHFNYDWEIFEWFDPDVPF